MELTWIIFSLASLLAVGLGDFIKKLVISKGGNKDVFLSVCFALFVSVFWVNYMLQGSGVFSQKTIQSAFIIGSCNFVIPLGLLTSLKYLNVSFALVTMRVVTSFLILYIGIYLLGDSLSFYNTLGFLLGIVAIFLLSGFRFGDIKNTMPRKGVIALTATIIGVTISNSYYKYVVEDLPIHDYTALQFSITALWIMLYMIVRNKRSQINTHEIQKVWWYAFVNVAIFVVYFLYLLPGMYLSGPLSLSYKMLSYSLVVPILLSIIFLGEPVNKTRIIAFGLTIISIFLFLV